jgi:segregation and condensation protein A
MMIPGIKTFQGEREENYRVQLPAFEGPLDLLLHLIKKNELNIYDIPIALITHQYLEYLDLMKSFNLNIAGEFLVMAATLIHIKSKMLLPPEDQEEETEEEDPRADLVRRLLEYQRFKHAAEGLSWREEIWRDVFRRENPPADPAGEEVVLSDVSLFDLMEALQAVLARVPKDKVLEIIPDEVSVRQRMSQMMERLEKVDGLIFEALFEGERTRAAVIVTFLALLELIRLQLANVQQIKIFEAIWISKAPETKEVADGEL